MTTIKERSRSINILDTSDVLVAGAGPAGVCAAIAAARAGATVRLIEPHGCLGGIWTSGLLSWIWDHANKDGVLRDIRKRLTDRGATNPAASNAYDPEDMKIVLEQMAREAGVKIRLYTRVVAAHLEENGTLAGVITESKSGREAFAARMFIDCTGDGDLAAQAGCQFELGHPETGACQPMTLLALITGIQGKLLQDQGVIRRGNRPLDCRPKLRAEFDRAGLDPSYAGPIILPLRDDLFMMMSNHIYGVSGLDAQQLTDATMQARQELHEQIAGLRSLGGPWANLRLVATAEQIGVREGRRIRGRYIVATEDMRQGIRHDDAVCRITFGIDVHALGKQGDGVAVERFEIKPYDIPLRSLLSTEHENLLMAGRCISGDFLSHSSYRQTGDAAAMGEAAGACAALAVQTNCMPHEVPAGDVQHAIGYPGPNIDVIATTREED